MVPEVLGHLVVPKRGEKKKQNKNMNLTNITESGNWHFAIEQHLMYYVVMTFQRFNLEDLQISLPVLFSAIN